MRNYWLTRKGKDSKCSYRPLSKREVIASDPHKIKGKGGSKRDLAVCVGANCNDRGAIVEHIKLKPPNKKGRKVQRKVSHFEPTGINIDDDDFKNKLNQSNEPTESTISVTLYVTGFKDDPEKLLSKLRFEANDSWKIGEPRGAGLKITHKENGFSIVPDAELDDLEDQMLDVLGKLRPIGSNLRNAGGKNLEIELSIGAYLVQSDIPAFHLSPRVVEMLAELKAEVDVDLYVISDGDADEDDD